MAILLLVFLLVAQHLNQVAAGNAPPAYGSRCVYADYTIYCYGGATSILNDVGLQGTQQFFALNVSDPITVAANSSSWYSIDFTGQTVQPEPNVFFSMAAIDEPDQKYIVIMGGAGKNDGTAMQHSTIYYDIEAGVWNTIDSGNHPQKRFQSLIFDKAGSKDRFFVWGGDRSASTGYWNETSNNDDVPFDMAVLSTDKWQWSSPTNNIQNLSLLMLPRTQHSAAQGGDGRIYITGGLEAYANVSSNGSVAYEFYSAPMTDTLVYDINTGWDIKNTTGDIPSERMFHTMVTSTDGKSILLYGGADTLFGSNNLPLPSRDVAYVLDISDPDNLVWKNITENLIQNYGPLDRYLRFHHTSILLNSSLFVLFGGNSGGVQQDFFIIDVDNWNVTNSFAGANVNGNASNGVGASGSSGISGGAIAGIVVGVVVGVGIIVGAIVFFFIRRKRQATKQSEKRDYISDSKGGSSHEPMHQSFLPPSYQEAATQRQEYLSSSNISEPPHTTSTTLPTRSSMEQQSYLVQQQAIKPHSDAHQRSSNSGGMPSPQQTGMPEVYVPRLKLTPVKPDGE